MDDLRAAVATALGLTPASRLIAIDAAALVDAAGLAVYAAVGSDGSPRSVVADPLRLPFVAALADVVVVRDAFDDDPTTRLREIWRVLAPAGALVVVVPDPTRRSIKALIRRPFIRRRVGRQLAAAMFEITAWQAAAGGNIVRAVKRDGLSPQRRVTAKVHAVASA